MKTVRFCLFVVILVLLTSMPASASLADIAERYRKASSEQERLTISIDAINKKVIRPGMKVSDMDTIFGTQDQREVPHLKGSIGSDLIYFSTSSFSWKLGFCFNESGEVLRYQLSNMNQKSEVNTPAEASIEDVAENFQKAKTEEERLKVCIWAIDQGMLHLNMPVFDVEKMFAGRRKGEIVKYEVVFLPFLYPQRITLGAYAVLLAWVKQLNRII